MTPHAAGRGRARPPTQRRPRAVAPWITRIDSVPRVQLLPIDSTFLAALETPTAFEHRHRLRLGLNAALVREVVAQYEAYRNVIGGASPEWGGYLAVDAATRDVVGAGAFRGTADAAEIAYLVIPAFEGRGYGTALAAALLRRAAAAGRAWPRTADTCSGSTASTRTSPQPGFMRAGVDVDPDVRPVWR